MFSGLITEVGRIVQSSVLGSGLSVSIQAPQSVLDLTKGDSIAVNGICSTVIDIVDDVFSVEYLEESCSRTTLRMLTDLDSVNLELSLKMSDRLGGHVVSGHVDGMGTITSIQSSPPFYEFYISFDSSHAPYLIEKGSIAIDGISLTVGKVLDKSFSVYIIPHTLEHTNLGLKKVGQCVNLEFDMMAKYLYRFYQLRCSNDNKN